MPEKLQNYTIIVSWLKYLPAVPVFKFSLFNSDFLFSVSPQLDIWCNISCYLTSQSVRVLYEAKFSNYCRIKMLCNSQWSSIVKVVVEKHNLVISSWWQNARHIIERDIEQRTESLYFKLSDNFWPHENEGERPGWILREIFIGRFYIDISWPNSHQWLGVGCVLSWSYNSAMCSPLITSGY